jgi:Putative cell wall binding repeat
MTVGWVLRPEGWYYTNKSGAMLTGWQKVSGKWYYLDATNEEYPGVMLAGCERIIGDKNILFYVIRSNASRMVFREWKLVLL